MPRPPQGSRTGWGARPRSRPGGPSLHPGRQSAGGALTGSSTEVARPRNSWPRRELLWEYPASRQRSGALGTSRGGREKCGRPTGQDGAAEAAAELWRWGRSRTSGWGTVLANPLELAESASASSPLCQGMAAGVEKRGPLTVCGLGAPTVHSRCTLLGGSPPPASRTPECLGLP